MSQEIKKNILMISPYVPWPLHGGTSVRIFNILKQLKNKGYNIILLAGSEEKEIKKDNPLNEICTQIHIFRIFSGSSLKFVIQSLFSIKPYPINKFDINELRKKTSYLLKENNIDLIWINLSILLEVFSRNFFTDKPILLDHAECEELFYKDYVKKGSLLEKFFGITNIIKFKYFHKINFLKTNAIFCVSEEETKFTKRQINNKVKVYTVPNGVDIKFFNPLDRFKKTSNYIVFCSSMNVRRNIDAASWFAKFIFPKIKSVIHDAEFWIVGSNPTKDVLELKAIPGVHITGTVDDIRPFYNKGKVFVSPYRFGAGTKLKVFEAMASGIPIVSTDIGCRGIDLTYKKDVIIAENVNDFSDGVIRLLSDDNFSYFLSENALKLVRQKYNWENIIEDVQKVIINLINS